VDKEWIKNLKVAFRLCYRNVLLLKKAYFSHIASISDVMSRHFAGKTIDLGDSDPQLWLTSGAPCR